MERFGKYDLLERIGSGGMAEVFLARPAGAALSKVVAVKRILPKLGDDLSFRQMFVREGAIALRFRHHAIIAVHELANVGDQYYICMEYFPGVPLTEIIALLRDKKGDLHELEKVLIIRSIAEALHYIHDFKNAGQPAGIIHRDISPHNILVGFDGGVKLIDFGVAKISTQDITQTKTIKGKIAYMSPEQVRGKTLNRQTDIFSLGIVFWELLTGRKLFTGKTISEVTKAIERCEVPSISALTSGVPMELIRICRRALNEHLSQRYSTAGEMVADLEAFVRESGREEVQDRLGESMQKLFPQRHEKLQQTLRKYELYDVPATPAPAPEPVPPPAAVSSIPRRSSISVSTPRPKPANPSARWLAGAVLLAVISATGAWFLHPDEPQGPPARSLARATPEPAPLPAPWPERPPAPVAVPPAAVPLPAPMAPAPAPKPHAVAAPAPKPVPIAVPRPVPLPVPPVSHPAPTPSRSPKPTPKPAARTAPKPAKTKKPRKPASTPLPPEKFARLTVLSDPGAQIWVDGKLAGSEVVNDLKVPADKPVRVKVIVNGVTKFKDVVFKPFSQNVIELGSK